MARVRVVAIWVFPVMIAASSSLSLMQTRLYDAVRPCAPVSAGGYAGVKGVLPGLRMSLRGGSQAEQTASDSEEPAEANGGLFPGEWDTWARMHGEPDCDYNVTNDIVNRGSKDEELAFRQQCDEELERHWARVKRIREEDIANNRSGCRHVADNEWCIRKSDGRIWKYRYEPDLYSGCGSSRDEDWLLPQPVDYVDPDYCREIADEMDRRDRERAQAHQDMLDAYERQEALEEALSWYNGSRRIEYEAGEPVWWRQLNASTFPNASCAVDRGRGTSQHPPVALPVREGPETPPARASEPPEHEDGSDGGDAEGEGARQEWCGSAQSGADRGARGAWRQPGAIPEGMAAAVDFTSYGRLPAGYAFQDVAAPALTPAQQDLFRRLQQEDALLDTRAAELQGVAGGGGGGGDDGAGGAGAGGGEDGIDRGGAGMPWTVGKGGEDGGQAAGKAEQTAAVMAAQAMSVFDASAAGAGDGSAGSGKAAAYVWDELGETLRSKLCVCVCACVCVCVLGWRGEYGMS